MKTESQLEIGGRQVKVSNLPKIFFPQTGFTKGQVIDYYIKISPYLLPHLHNRPLTFKRYPEGAGGFFFYEKECPSPHPAWIETFAVPRTAGGAINFCLINNLPALIWAANLADLELHTFLHRAPAIARPTFLAFDLDPGPPADLVQCCVVALQLRDLFARFRLQCFAKTSGSKGLQVFIPLNTPITYAKSKAFAQAVATSLEREFPGLILSRMARDLRSGKVFVDWSQNDEHKTTVCVYSLRAKDRPTVSTPVTWDEVAATVKRKNARSLSFEAAVVLQRVKKMGDLFAPVLTLKQKLPQGFTK